MKAPILWGMAFSLLVQFDALLNHYPVNLSLLIHSKSVTTFGESRMLREIYYENYLSTRDAFFNNMKLDILSYLKLKFGWFTLSRFLLISHPSGTISESICFRMCMLHDPLDGYTRNLLVFSLRILNSCSYFYCTLDQYQTFSCNVAVGKNSARN